MARQLDYHSLDEIFRRFQAADPEPKGELDRFIEAMRMIAEEAEDNPDLLRSAPTRCRLRRLDETAAARKPCLKD